MKMFRHIVSFIILSVIVMASLVVLNSLPQLFHSDALREYPDIDSASGATDIGHIFVPTYFPLGIKWPPSRVMAQKMPFKAISTDYRDPESGDIVLAVHQSEEQRFINYEPIELKEMLQTAEHKLNDHDALLEVGICGGGIQCSRITWVQDGVFIRVEMRAGPFELIRIAGSIRSR